MTTRFDYCLDFVLKAEGGDSNDPADRGGKTRKGITQTTFTRWLESQNCPDQDVFTATDANIRAIYFDLYWVPSKCSILPEPVDLVVFDTAVNMGVGRAVRFLQTALGVGSDGQFGPQSITALHEEIAAGQQEEVAMGIIRLRSEKYDAIVQKDPSQARFRKGWGNRLLALHECVQEDVA